MTYKFRYRKCLFFRTLTVIGHRYDKDQDKMVVHFTDGGVQEIKKWTNCEVKLGTDWLAFQKKQMELQAGQAIPVARG